MMILFESVWFQKFFVTYSREINILKLRLELQLKD
jgi:hypothetical protein